MLRYSLFLRLQERPPATITKNTGDSSSAEWEKGQRRYHYVGVVIWCVHNVFFVINEVQPLMSRLRQRTEEDELSVFTMRFRMNIHSL